MSADPESGPGHFPATAADVTPGWLTEMLRAGCPDFPATARVKDFRSHTVGAGMFGDSVRFSLDKDCDGGPDSLVIKFAAADPVSRENGWALSLYPTEIRFYRDIAPEVEISRPACWFADGDAESGDFAIVMEDLSPARQGDQLTGCSIEDAAEAMRQAAALHAPRWADPDLATLPWLADKAPVFEHVVASYPAAVAEFHRRYDDVLEPEYMAICDWFAERATGFFTLDYGPKTFIHLDFRLDNMLFDAKGGERPLVVLDWQSVTVGPGAVDVAYFLGAGISPEMRAAHEPELLGLYLSQLQRRGVEGYTMDDLRRDYALALWQGVSTSIHASAATKRTERGDAMFMAMCRGACRQALDNDAQAVLERAIG